MSNQRSQLGQYIKLCSIRQGQPFLTLGPHKLQMILLFLVFNIASIVMLILLNRKSQAYVFFMVHFVILIYLDTTWLATTLINPGIILKDANEQYGCQYCKNNYPAESNVIAIKEHCKICQVCIEDKSHHCFMTGGCIGTGNLIVYYFFLLGLVLWAIDFISTAPYLYYMN